MKQIFVKILIGPAPFRGYHDGKDDFPPPPPPPTSAYMDHNFPPPPPETKENIYHEIRDEDFPPPPPAGPEPMYTRPGKIYTGSISLP